MTQIEFLLQIADTLTAAGIPFMVAGSQGSNYHGMPRSTNDVDLVIDPSPQQLEKFLLLVSEGNYVSQEMRADALRNQSMFNVINFTLGEKADLIIRKKRPFSIEEFARRVTGTLMSKPVPFASAEDVILSKLEWNKITPSERQVRDALNVARVRWAVLDRDYLRKWGSEVGVSQELEELLRDAEQQQSG